MKAIQIKRKILKEERDGRRLIEYLTIPIIDLRPEDLTKRFSRHFLPSQKGPLESKNMTASAVLDAVNRDLPETWKRLMSGINGKD